MRCALLTLVALVACQDKRPELPPPPAAPKDGVTLIQAGQAPHQLLRYRFTKGTTTTSELVYDFEARSEPQGSDPAGQGSASAAAGSGAGSGAASGAATGVSRSATADSAAGAGSAKAKAPAPAATTDAPAPTLIVTLETTVEDVLPDGTARLRIAVRKTRVRDQPGNLIAGETLRAQAASAEGLVFTELVAPDGKVSDTRIDTSGNMPARARARLDSLIQSLERVAMQLPREPVGVGATWSERKPLPEGGIRAMSETTYTLTALAGTTASYTATGRSTGANQTIQEAGMTVQITNPRGQSETTGTLDLARYTADVSSKSTFTAQMAVDAPAGTPGAGASTVEVSLAIRLSPASAPAPDGSDDSAPASPSTGTSAPAAAAPAAPAEPAGPASGGPAAQGAHKAP